MIYDPTEDFFYWVTSLNIEPCDEYLCYDQNDLEDEGKARFIEIYHTTSDLENHCIGVFFDQQLNRASFPLTIGDIENVEPVDEREDMWFPLETILTHWIFLIRLGKVVAGRHDWPAKQRSVPGLWAWLPYCEAQVDNTVAAYERYRVTVESRMPTHSALPIYN
jgi:hypothetical protein